jgi:hypothetical protein
LRTFDFEVLEVGVRADELGKGDAVFVAEVEVVELNGLGIF